MRHCWHQSIHAVFNNQKSMLCLFFPVLPKPPVLMSLAQSNVRVLEVCMHRSKPQAPAMLLPSRNSPCAQTRRGECSSQTHLCKATYNRCQRAGNMHNVLTFGPRSMNVECAAAGTRYGLASHPATDCQHERGIAPRWPLQPPRGRGMQHDQSYHCNTFKTHQYVPVILVARIAEISFICCACTTSAAANPWSFRWNIA